MVGRQRVARVTLRNDSHADLTEVRLSVQWGALGDEDCRAAAAVTLPRHSVRHLELPLKPERADEHMLTLRLQGDLGGFLQQSVVAEALHLKVSPVPHTPGELKVIVGDVVVGAKGLYGQMQEEGATTTIGHTINIHQGASLDQQIEQWMQEDPALQAGRELRLWVEGTVCRDWHNDTGMELAGVQAGTFEMGRSAVDPEAKPDELPRRRVQLPNGFWMGRTPVTQAQYERVMKAVPTMKYANFLKESHPVVNVSWNDAVKFCRDLTRDEQAAGALPPGYAYRLPTEAEWEYACRAGCEAPRYGELRTIAASEASGKYFGPVGMYEPNKWGLLDMLGLVFEWCADVYARYQPLSQVDPLRGLEGDETPETVERVLRGGCYQGPDHFARASARASQPANVISLRIGFRVVLARYDSPGPGGKFP